MITEAKVKEVERILADAEKMSAKDAKNYIQTKELIRQGEELIETETDPERREKILDKLESLYRMRRIYGCFCEANAEQLRLTREVLCDVSTEFERQGN